MGRHKRNIGVGAYHIAVELAGLLSDIRYWIEHETFQPDEIAIRFHHRLVAIHPFPNGNGRHARLAADLLIERLTANVSVGAAAVWATLAYYALDTSRPCAQQTIMI